MTTPTITDAMWVGPIGQVLYVPLLNILTLFYVYIPGQDLGFAIIALTILIRLILHPSYVASLKSQRDLQRIQPYINKVREEHKEDSKKQSEEIMNLYKEHKVNPLGSCLPLVIQLPLVLALYKVFVAGLTSASLTHLYSWFPHAPLELNTIFLRFTGIEWLMVDLSKPHWMLAATAAIAQMVQGWYSMKRTPIAPQSTWLNTGLLVFALPGVTFFIGLSLPSALALYWTVTTLVMFAQQLIAYRSFDLADKTLDLETSHGK